MSFGLGVVLWRKFAVDGTWRVVGRRDETSDETSWSFTSARLGLREFVLPDVLAGEKSVLLGLWTVLQVAIAFVVVVVCVIVLFRWK